MVNARCSRVFGLQGPQVFLHRIHVWYTLPETNSEFATENWWLDFFSFPFGTPYVQVLSLFQGGKYLHLVDLSGKCMVNVWYTYHTWILWAIGWTYTKQHPDKQSLVLFIVKFESWSTGNVCVEVIKIISKGSTWMTMCWLIHSLQRPTFFPRKLQSWQQIQEPFFGSWKLTTMFSQPSSFRKIFQTRGILRLPNAITKDLSQP